MDELAALAGELAQVERLVQDLPPAAHAGAVPGQALLGERAAGRSLQAGHARSPRPLRRPATDTAPGPRHRRGGGCGREPGAGQAAASAAAARGRHAGQRPARGVGAPWAWAGGAGPSAVGAVREGRRGRSAARARAGVPQP